MGERRGRRLAAMPHGENRLMTTTPSHWLPHGVIILREACFLCFRKGGYSSSTRYVSHARYTGFSRGDRSLGLAPAVGDVSEICLANGRLARLLTTVGCF